MKRFISILLVLVSIPSLLLLGGCGDSDYTLSPDYNPINMSDTAECSCITDDSVTYTFTNGVPPNLAPGQIIASGDGDGFLRKITSVSVSGNTITAQTEQAVLTDALEDADMIDTVPLDVGAAASPESTGLKLVKALDGVQVTKAGIPLNNVTIFSGSGLTVRIPSGNINFDTDLDIGLRIRKAKLEEFHAIAGGSMAVDLDIEATASKTISYGKEISLAQFQSVAVQWIGPVPIVEVITLDFVVGFDAALTGTMTARTGIDGSASLSIGARYENGSWDGVRTASKSMSATPPTFSGSAGLTIRGYVRPAISVKFYSIAGPELGLEPYLEFDGTLVAGPAIDWDLSAGIDLVVAFEISLLGKDLARFDKSFNIWAMSLASGTIGASYNLTGTWDLKFYEGPSYGLHELVLTQSGSNLSGRIDSNNVTGTVSSNNVTIVEPLIGFTLTYTGTIASGSGSMSGTWDDGGGTDQWSAAKR